MRERVLAFVRAIVRPSVRPSVRPTVVSARSPASPVRVFYTCAFMDCLTAAAYKLEER